MKLISKILVIAIIVPLFLVGCSDMFDVKSDKYVTEAEYGMKNPNDTLYSMFGIYNKLGKLVNSYVLLGELRGDLLDVSETASESLRQISDFRVTAGNRYINISDYYAVINNCNYVIQNIDTFYVSKAQKVLLREYVAAKSIRAWTYMQIALNFGMAKYYEKPILNISDANQTFPEYDILGLADVLIKDLEQYKDVDFPDYGNLGAFNTQYSFFPIRFLLGDLYLWKGDYLNAAQNYHDLMYKNSYTVNSTFRAYWIVNAGTFSSSINMWSSKFNQGSNEEISALPVSNATEHVYDLEVINYSYMLKASSVANANWDQQIYFDYTGNVVSTTTGDLRKEGSLYDLTVKQNNVISKQQIIRKLMFEKLDSMSWAVPVYRTSLLYLRYAEAVNRLGKPNLAFAVIKNGLNTTNMSNTKIVPTHESGTPVPSYMNFSYTRFDNNIGIRMQGLGNVNKDSTYVIPTFTNGTVADSINYVEDLIQKELALETAFEGNRFHDLMRFAIRRDDNAYLADKIAAKHVGNESGFKSLLMNRANWYLKK